MGRTMMRGVKKKDPRKNYGIIYIYYKSKWNTEIMNKIDETPIVWNFDAAPLRLSWNPGSTTRIFHPRLLWV